MFFQCCGLGFPNLTFMQWLDLVQWPAMAVTLLASWFVASTNEGRRGVGFWLFLASNVLWIVWASQAHAWALIALQIGLAIMNIRGAKKAAPPDQRRSSLSAVQRPLSVYEPGSATFLHAALLLSDKTGSRLATGCLAPITESSVPCRPEDPSHAPGRRPLRRKAASPRSTVPSTQHTRPPQTRPRLDSATCNAARMNGTGRQNLP